MPGGAGTPGIRRMARQNVDVQVGDLLGQIFQWKLKKHGSGQQETSFARFVACFWLMETIAFTAIVSIARSLARNMSEKVCFFSWLFTGKRVKSERHAEHSKNTNVKTNVKTKICVALLRTRQKTANFQSQHSLSSARQSARLGVLC